ncbi:hypothetical protein MBLNU457_7182t1 [Dothideomycetes sp. NU457]
MSGNAMLQLELNLLMASAATLLAVSLLVFILRMIVRSKIVKHIQAADWLMLISQTLFSVTCALSLYASLIERSAIDTQTQDAGSKAYVLIKALTACYAISVNFSKWSLCVWVPKHFRWQRTIINVYLFLMTCFGVVYLCMTFFPCGSQQAFLGNSCNAASLSYYFNIAWTALNLLGDFLIITSAVYALCIARSSTATKIMASFTLGLGLLAPAAAAARLFVLATQPTATDSERLTLSLLAINEAGLYIIAGSLATLRPLFDSCLGRELSTDAAMDEEMGDSSGRYEQVKSAKTTPDPTPKAEHIEWATLKSAAETSVWSAPRKSKSRTEGYEEARESSIAAKPQDRSTPRQAAKPKRQLSEMERVIEADRRIVEEMSRSRVSRRTNERREVQTDRTESRRKRQALLISTREMDEVDISPLGSPML